MRSSNSMLHLIDVDAAYEMREHEDARDLDVTCGAYRASFTDGILLTDSIKHIHLNTRMDGAHRENYIPSFVLFDSLNGRIQTDERMRRDLLYFEYAVIRADGASEIVGARNVRSVMTRRQNAHAEIQALLHETVSYEIDAVRYRDHALLRITNAYSSQEIIIALPDSTCFCYLSITGEHCVIDGVEISSAGQRIDANYIPRIAEKISYIDVPAGDIPNVQIDAWRSAVSQGIEVTDGMQISFHTMSLPTARLIWHCPFAVLYTADDGQVNGKAYRELTLVRLDGECWEDDDAAENAVYVNRLDSFRGWNEWKAQNKAGQECRICYHLEQNNVIITAEYCGLSIRSITTLHEDVPKLYTALTGDQCAVTNIRITRSS